MLIDTHVHMYPSLEDGFKLAGFDADLPKLKTPGLLKKWMNKPQSKINALLQEAGPMLRSLPKKLLPYAEKIHGAAALGGTVINSGKKDLLESMRKNGIDLAFVIAHPPLISNEFVLQECETESALFPIVNIPKNSQNPESLLESYIDRGAIALKIHAAADGFSNEDPHYTRLLKAANEASLPVVIHTGCIHLKPFYKEPEMGHAEKFQDWFLKYPNIRFVLAHMNYHYPEKAISFCERFENVYTDCSWQPTDVIQQAVERISDKIMFGSDWPIVGSNQETMLKRVRQVEASAEKMEALFHLNAKRVFGI